MSINMDSEGLEYADHEVQALNFQISATEDVEQEFQTEPVSENGVDSDELAELVAMYRLGSFITKGAVSSDYNSGNEMNLGINTTGKEEALTDAPSNATIEQRTDNLASLGEISDPGVLDSYTIGTANNTSNAVTERFVDFRTVFGSGPFVDRTDDLVFQGEITSQGNTVQAEGQYILYWAVEEQPDGRASFARP